MSSLRRIGAINSFFLTLVLFLIVAVVFWIYLSNFYENPPVKILNDPVPVNREQYQPGERIVLHIQADIRSQASSELSISWRTFPQTPLPVDKLKVGGLPRGVIERDFSITVPGTLSPGIYFLEVESFYEVSPFYNDRKVTWYSQSFEVIPKQEPEPRIIIQEVDRPIYVVEYIYTNGPPSEVTVPAIGGNPPFLVSSPSPAPSPEPVGDQHNGATVPTPEPAPVPPKPVIIIIITPEPIEVVPPTKHELQMERREEHKAEIIERQEEHRAEVAARQDERSKK